MAKYKILATDLDGTLLNSEAQIDGKNKKAIERVLELGVLFVPATGRTYGEIPEYVASNPAVRYIIHSNGGVVLDTKTGKKISFCIRKSDARRLFDTLLKYDVHLTVRYNGVCYADPTALEQGADEYYNIEKNHINVIRQYATFPNDFRTLIYEFDEVEVVSAYFHSDTERKAFKNEIESSGRIRAVVVGGVGLEIFDMSAGKGAALSALCDELGIDVGDSIGVGDSGNDISMIKTAGVGLAVENAVEDLKSAANAVICSNNDGVIAYILENFLSE